MINIISFLIGIGGLIFGVWQYFESQKSHRLLVLKLGQMPLQISQLLNTFNNQADKDQKNQSGLIHAQTVDIDNDGTLELLVDFPAGAHGANMKVYKYNFMDGLVEMDTLAADAGPYFEIGDFNNDGQLEVAAYHRNYSGNPVGDPSIRRLYRMEKGRFHQLK